MDKNTIYIVTSGDCSGYQVDAVFDSIGLAKRYITLVGTEHSGHVVEEYKLNGEWPRMDSDIKVFDVVMRRNGDCKVHWDAEYDEPPIPLKLKGSAIGEYVLTGWVAASSKKHAASIANAMRKRLRGDGDWPE